MRARVLVHGATGYTGRLVCDALRRRGIAFDISGRDRAKLETLAQEAGANEVHLIDLGAPETLRPALEGRTLVCACAGPFALVGEPILATAARLGVHYVDTTGEQSFVELAVHRYRPTAEASGACMVPAMAYEIALSDWAAHLAAQAVGGAPDSIAITYASGGSAGASRGTKRSAIGVLTSEEPKQFVDGRLVVERAAAHLRRVDVGGETITAVSFPSPEAVVVPSHTGARSVRTFMAMPRARLLHAARALLPTVVRTFRGPVERAIGRAPVGPTGAERAASTFCIVCEATRESTSATVVLRGRDPYGLTAELQAYAAERALAGEIEARGVVAPSVAFDATRGLAAMATFGLEVIR